ncbi:hypothetical protein [uncultured Anaerococcus sp.]|uniref:hypothetical protein n=1 Tax=uncultured Anaerococcus sp. TaxID=293428 RepID=UPI0025F26B83|nr:hypothetical protein [uncultured Anaerococcus sp.]
MSTRKNNSFLSFLDKIQDEIDEENKSKISYKSKGSRKISGSRKVRRKSSSFVGFLNNLVEEMDNDFGDLDLKESKKPDYESQRRLKAELIRKHGEKLKKTSPIDRAANKSLIDSEKGKKGSIESKSVEGDNKALKRLRKEEEIENRKKTVKKLAKIKNRQRLRDAMVMAEILGPPVSKRR